jgi:hypothetical protein
MILGAFGWTLLIAAPRSRLTQMLLGETRLHILICLIYTASILTIYDLNEKAGFFSHDGVIELFKSQAAIRAAWIHIIAFDLFVATWITQDALKKNLPRYKLLPVQLLTLFLGPLGFLTYRLIVRFGRRPTVAAVT